MWLTCSSIGRKFVMALTGVALVLFVTFHCLMNSVAIVWPAAYNEICQFLGANWYALVASAGLAALFIIHIIYALWLTIQNRKARGADRYAVNSRPKQVEWASKNMLVLGIVVLAFLVVHMIQFWAKMQLVELLHHELSALPELEGVPQDPVFGTIMIQAAFSQVWTPIVYIIGFIALWFHMNHGFWSMFHTIGWDNKIWIERLKKIGLVWSTVVVALFVAQAVVFTVQANKKHYTTDPSLLYQYAKINPEYAPRYVEILANQAEPAVSSFMNDYQQAAGMAQMFNNDSFMRALIVEKGDSIVGVFAPIAERMEGIPAAQSNEVLMQVPAIINFIKSSKSRMAAQAEAEAAAQAAQDAAAAAAAQAAQEAAARAAQEAQEAAQPENDTNN